MHHGFKIQVGQGQAFDVGDQDFVLVIRLKDEATGVFVPGAEKVNEAFDQEIGFTRTGNPGV